MIKTIIFDLGGVIVPFDFQRVYASVESLCPYSASEVRERIGASGLAHRFESGQMEAADFAREFSGLIGLNVNYDEFCRLWNSIFHLDEAMPAGFFAALKRRYRLLLLSNTNVLHFQMLRAELPLFDHFDDFVLSYEVGAMKPAPEVFSAVIQRARCEPAECFFTDDIAAYVEAARRAGIDAVQYQSPIQLRQELRTRNVEWQE